MKEKQDKGLARRDFLRNAGLGLGAAGITAAGVSVPKAKAAVRGGARPDDAGYRETEHVKRYYALARF